MTNKKEKTNPKKKNPKQDIYDSVENNLYRRLENVQEELIEQGKLIISEWLNDADADGHFEDAVDWLFSDAGADFFSYRKGVFAYEIASYAIDRFENEGSDDSESDEDEVDFEDSENDSDDGEEETLYDQVPPVLPDTHMRRYLSPVFLSVYRSMCCHLIFILSVPLRMPVPTNSSIYSRNSKRISRASWLCPPEL